MNKNLSSDFGKTSNVQNPFLQQLGAPHVNSFNYLLNKGLLKAVTNLNPIEFYLKDDKICFKIVNAKISPSFISNDTIGGKSKKIYPSECRQRAVTYKGRLTVRINWFINNEAQTPFEKNLGDIPIMVKSNLCHLADLSPKQLVVHGEHEQEWGGYFIVKGHEKIIRMLLLPRRNYPISIKRPSWKQRGTKFSDLGLLIRCVSDDQTTTNNVLHYLNDGTAKLMISYKKKIYFIPVLLILKCLCNHADQYIFKKITAGFEQDIFFLNCIKKMLRLNHSDNLHTTVDCKNYVGELFRTKCTECPEWFTELEVADYLIKNCILIHLKTNEDKFNLLIFMIQKLFCLAQDKCHVEGVDSVMMQEVLLSGHLYLQILKDKLQSWLNILKLNILKKSPINNNCKISQNDLIPLIKRSGTVEASMELFLATGNLNTQSGLGLMQDKGLTIIAENINRMRYMSHFKSVHRGTFFQEMRTTEARQLLPDAWGFICPVHTPDGAPCGLLNHLTMNCIITEEVEESKLNNIPIVLLTLGMRTLEHGIVDIKKDYFIHLNGSVIGIISKNIVNKVVNNLRIYKIENKEIPKTLEIVLVPIKDYPSQYPGLFLFTEPARMMRPVVNLALQKVELIGTFEQVYLEIAVTSNEFHKGVTTHMELSKQNFLSNLAQLIPLPDCNQSPRNMYQCQMGKQTIGIPCHNWSLQANTKLYRLITPQSPLFRTKHYEQLGLDDFSMGTNAIVAVISYTGYDMEDAMTINKASLERGFNHGCIYKTEFIELENFCYFSRDPENHILSEYLDTDGLPFISCTLKYNQPYYSYYNPNESKYVVKRFFGNENVIVDNVKRYNNLQDNSKFCASITLRVPRYPMVGDKFASRAGQKGVCSNIWYAEDLPFTESGMVPDIIFNPHGFPSRMTIAMMIELMAGKAAALDGVTHDATPFKFNETNTAIDYFGKLLQNNGYNYCGNETMYSGINGRQMTVQIFFGVVYYQRLRHMVLDKWQARSTGPIDILTRQPLKGRKRGGGIRFGEMERDSLISHGIPFLLQDRLFHCSDKYLGRICVKCGLIITPTILLKKNSSDKVFSLEVCNICGHRNKIAPFEIPYIYKFLVSELTAFNINLRFLCEFKS